MASSTNSDRDKGARASAFRRFFRSPMSPLVVFCVLSLVIEENYPFSNYPMYSGIAKRSHYFYLADGEGNPIPTRQNFSKSAAGVKKLYGARLDKIANDKGTRASKLGWDEQVLAGRALLDYLRERGEKKSFWRKNKPDVLKLIRVDISRDGSGIVRKERVVVEEAATP